MVVITYYNARDDGNGEIRGIRGGQYMKDLRTEKGIIMSKNIKDTMIIMHEKGDYNGYYSGDNQRT